MDNEKIIRALSCWQSEIELVPGALVMDYVPSTEYTKSNLQNFEASYANFKWMYQ